MKVIHKLECFPTGDMVVPYCPNCNEPTYDEPNCPFCNTKLEYGDDINLKQEIETHIKLNKRLLEDIDKAGKEIERLQNQNKSLNEMYELLKKEYIKSQNKVEDLQADYGNKAQVERDLLEQENQRLNNIIKEVREKINKTLNINSDYVDYDFGTELLRQELLGILDKGE